jgi:hypothetical protein
MLYLGTKDIYAVVGPVMAYAAPVGIPQEEARAQRPILQQLAG